ncbi:MAG: hypothetical protein MUC88_01395 [Planctomycetes bacterium]|jgi:hypothetical protein|nr:hypothetical protein [Planctomycetota bacterium]
MNMRREKDRCGIRIGVLAPMFIAACGAKADSTLGPAENLGPLVNTASHAGGVPARPVKLTVTKNWGIAPRTGLSEVRCFYLPEPSGAQPRGRL